MISGMKIKTVLSFLSIMLLLQGYSYAQKPVTYKTEMESNNNKDASITGPAGSVVAVAEGKANKDSATTRGNFLTGKYATANRLYFRMIDSMVKVISEYPIQDSAGLSYAADWVGTPNMGLRRPNYVIIHYTATNGFDEVLQEFMATGGREASAHYVICKYGTVYHMLNDLLLSHHAGDSKWGNTTDLNSSSIGIEVVNNGYEAFTNEQMNSLTILLERLKTAYKIPDANFLGHGDIAPTRKSDPGKQFPWQDLSKKGFGLWWDDTTNVQIPDNFDYLMALRIIGYDISAPASAVAAFKRHFMQDNSGGSMNAVVRKVIYTLYRKFE